MENATDAILIAGGILLAILTISVLVLATNNMAIIQEANLSKEETQRLTKWNLEWEAYNKKLLYDAEVLTIINKAKQNNINYYGNSEYQVNVKVFFSDGTEITNAEEYVKNSVQNKQNKIYSCIEMLYNNTTGRIQNIKFKIVE